MQVVVNARKSQPEGLRLDKRQLVQPAAALLGVLRAGVVDQDLAHHLRRHAEKMDPVADLGRGLAPAKRAYISWTSAVGCRV